MVPVTSQWGNLGLTIGGNAQRTIAILDFDLKKFRDMVDVYDFVFIQVSEKDVQDMFDPYLKLDCRQLKLGCRQVATQSKGQAKLRFKTAASKDVMSVRNTEFVSIFSEFSSVREVYRVSDYLLSENSVVQVSQLLPSSETRPPMLERGSYIPWESRFRRYINRKRENRKWLNKALDEGPYQFEMFIPNNSTVLKLQTAEDLQGDALLHYDAEMELMNLILLSIPNDIYNSVDACTSAKDMWKRVERLMRGTIQNKVDRETRFTNEFDQFVAKPGEALVLVYNHFAQLMNDLERNDMHFLIVTINTKFLNSLQPEWLKYVTQVRLAKRLTVDTFDDLFDYLQQFEKLVNVSRAKKLEKSHDPLALVAHTGSSSRNTSSYYVTHPTSVVDYEDEYQQDDVHTNSEDPITSAMLLLARAITHNFSTLTNNRLCTSSNTRNQAII
ncbi:hypothetical protein Tco_1362380 [Tanacetum coccineum]